MCSADPEEMLHNFGFSGTQRNKREQIETLSYWVLLLLCYWSNDFVMVDPKSVALTRAFPGSEFVVTNSLAKWKKSWSQMKLTLAKVIARK